MLTGARRSGPYRVDRLTLRYGIDAKLFEWTDQITTDCWRKQAQTDARQFLTWRQSAFFSTDLGPLSISALESRAKRKLTSSRAGTR